MKKLFKFVLCAVIETILSELFIKNGSIISGIIIFIAVYIILSLVVNVIK